MNWLDRARREIPKSARRRTAITAERTLTAGMAVPQPALRELERSLLIGMLDMTRGLCYRLKHGYNLPNESSQIPARFP
jgi:hypothetical protein